MSYSLKDLAKDAITGNIETVNQEVYKTRLSICAKCPNLKLRTCTKCGCMVDFKAKLIKSSCPIGNW